MEYSLRDVHTPLIIIHGGAGNITQPNLPPDRQTAYKDSLIRILRHGRSLVYNGASALEAATSTVALFEDDPLFNCGHGAVFNKAGGIELEASVMVSTGFKKRCAAVSLLKHVKNPILLAKGILEHGEQDLEESPGGNDGAQGHVHISGSAAEDLAKAYSLELRPEKYFWTRKRWEEHKRGLKESSVSWEDVCGIQDLEEQQLPWDGFEYLPQGTVGCVVLDNKGTICAATSTGGLTNKLPGRIGDTPTVGAGFWAEEGPLRTTALERPTGTISSTSMTSIYNSLAPLSSFLPSTLADCLPFPLKATNYQPIPASEKAVVSDTHVLGLSGTGNGDSFLRTAACRTAAALALPPSTSAHSLLSGPPNMTSASTTLQTAVSLVTGPGGLLQKSAEDRWLKTGEGQGGIIGIERRGTESAVVFDMNCGGMFRAYAPDPSKMYVGIFRGDDSLVPETQSQHIRK